MVRQRHAPSAPLSPVANTENDNHKRRKERRAISISNGVVTRKTRLVCCLGIGGSPFTCSFAALACTIHSKNAMPGYIPQSLPKKLTPVPPLHAKTFWSDGKKISFPMVRALRDHGWQKVNDWKDAQIIYQYSAESKFFHELKRWQRFGHVPRYR